MATPLRKGWQEKDEVSSCRGTVLSAWKKPSVRRKGGRAGLPARVSGRHVVRGRQSSPTLEVRLGEQARLVKTVNIQVKWAAAHPLQDRRLPNVATHPRLQRATSVRTRVGIVHEDGSGVAIEWVTGRTPPHGDGSMYSQANVRARKFAALPYPSVAVRDRGHWKGVAGSGWVRGAFRGKTARGWKRVRTRVRLV